MFENLDAVSPSSITVHSSPTECLRWRADVKINSLAWRPERNEFKVGQDIGGLHFEFSHGGLWPDYVPPDWDGAIQYTVWAGFFINGAWHAAGFIQMWRDRYQTGAPIIKQFASNWAYDPRWGALNKYQPKAGEEMILFLTAGNARSGSAGPGPITLHEGRSNIIKVKVPANDYGDFNFTYPVDEEVVETPEVIGGGAGIGQPVPPDATGYIVAKLMEIEKSVNELKAMQYVAVQDGFVDFLGQRKFKIVTVLTPKDK